jgi:hypothetical protein
MQGLLETPGLTVAGHLIHGQVKEAPSTAHGLVFLKFTYLQEKN